MTRILAKLRCCIVNFLLSSASLTLALWFCPQIKDPFSQCYGDPSYRRLFVYVSLPSFVSFYFIFYDLFTGYTAHWSHKVEKISIPPTEDTFVLAPHPLEFPFQVLVIPSTPWNFRKFPTWLGSPGENIFVKNAVALYFFAKDNCFCDLFMLIQYQGILILPCRGLS